MTCLPSGFSVHPPKLLQSSLEFTYNHTHTEVKHTDQGKISPCGAGKVLSTTDFIIKAAFILKCIALHISTSMSLSCIKLYFNKDFGGRLSVGVICKAVLKAGIHNVFFCSKMNQN